MFLFVRNLAGFPANPGIYPLKADTAFTKGNLVKAGDGVIDNSAAADTESVGVMAETVGANEKTEGVVYDNPLDVFRAPYTGTATPKVFSKLSVAADDSGVIDADSLDGPLTVVSVDTENKTADVIITGHTLK